MQFSLENDIFQGNEFMEICQVLHRMRNYFIDNYNQRDFSQHQNIRDINGNIIGTFVIKKELT